ncbi:MAG: hypothetical protein U0229_02680 [Anaeromyxobacter sp.]
MTNRTRLAVAAVAVAAVLGTVAYAVRHRQQRAAKAHAAHRLPQRPPVQLNVSDLAPEPSAWIDVHAPEKAWKALRTNAWLGRAADAPLGQGLAAGWSGFLGTKGADLAGAFDGAVLDLVAGPLLGDPFRVVYYGGPSATGAPAVLVPKPSSRAKGAFELLEAAARNGSFEAPRCPGPEPETKDVKPGAKDPEPIVVSRWLLSEHSVYAGQREGRLALGRTPTAVVQALCAAPPEAPAAGADVTLAFAPRALGRDSELAAALLGLGPAPRLTFAIEGDRLKPVGMSSELAKPERLGAQAAPDALLKLVPAGTGVVLVAALNLPARLDRETLKQHLDGSYRGPRAVRPVAIVWNPRGDAFQPTEVAVAWPEGDAAFLDDAFSGPNRLERRRGCGHLVLASTGALAGEMARACQGKAPSILDATPAASEGLRQPASLELGVNLGLVLSRLVEDSYAGEVRSAGKPRTPPPELDAARRLLEELPYLGLRGRVEGNALVPGGFRS